MNMRPCSNALFLLLIRSLILCFASTAGKLLMWKFSRGEVAGINGFIQQIVIKLPLCLIQGIGSIMLPLMFSSLAVSQSLVTNAGHKARAGIMLLLDRCSETPCVILLSPLPAQLST